MIRTKGPAKGRRHFGSVIRALLVFPVFLTAQSYGDISAPERPVMLPPTQVHIPKDYRVHWQALSKLAVSGMHWNQWVIVYSNVGASSYHSNQTLWQQQEQAGDWTDANATNTQAFRHYQPGTILVKEGFSGQRADALRPDFLAIMVKHKPGYDPSNGDWEFIQSAPNGQVMLSGPLSSSAVGTTCGGCHTNVADRDYVFATTGMGSR